MSPRFMWRSVTKCVSLSSKSSATFVDEEEWSCMFSRVVWKFYWRKLWKMHWTIMYCWITLFMHLLLVMRLWSCKPWAPDHGAVGHGNTGPGSCEWTGVAEAKGGNRQRHRNLERGARSRVMCAGWMDQWGPHVRWKLWNYLTCSSARLFNISTHCRDLQNPKTRCV
jgi:hypothetical protein